MSGRDDYNRMVFNQSNGFNFSKDQEFTISEIRKAVNLLESSYLVPPPKCLVLLLIDQIPSHYLGFCCLSDESPHPKDKPLRLRGSPKKIVTAINEFIHAGGKEWLKQNDRANRGC